MPTFAAFTRRLRTRLAGTLPGPPAQLSMAPAYRQDAALADVRGKACREAGVLALLFPEADVPTLVLTVRHGYLKEHAGQISFPGGRREEGEALRDTALREAHEEIGLAPELVDVLGALTPLYIPPSNFCVYPFVGAVPEPPTLRPTDAEVEAILRVPLPRLLDPQTRRRAPWRLRGREVVVPFFDLGGHRVWGATAMMLAELLALVTGDDGAPPQSTTPQ